MFSCCNYSILYSFNYIMHFDWININNHTILTQTNQHIIVYEDIYDAKRAVDHLSGFNVGGRYLVVMYYQPAKFEKRADAEFKRKEIEDLRRQIKNKKAQMAKAAEKEAETQS